MSIPIRIDPTSTEKAVARFYVPPENMDEMLDTVTRLGGRTSLFSRHKTSPWVLVASLPQCAWDEAISTARALGGRYNPTDLLPPTL